MQELRDGSDIRIDGVWYRIQSIGAFQDADTKAVTRLLVNIRELNEDEIKKAEKFHG